MTIGEQEREREREEEESGGKIPEWVLTFGDMMSLLLTFFIMLVSMSEIKQEEKFQTMVESIRRQFGYQTTRSSVMPGPTKPRNSPVAHLATKSRSRKLDTTRGGQKIRAPVGDQPAVQIIRPGNRTAVGAVIYFDQGGWELSERQHGDLQAMGVELSGKPQKIEIRGHTSRRPLPPTELCKDHWDLAYRRCRATQQYLVQQLQIDPQRVRISVAGPHEPVHLGTDPQQLARNGRVEVFLLDEVVSDLSGTERQRQQRFTPGNE